MSESFFNEVAWVESRVDAHPYGEDQWALMVDSTIIAAGDEDLAYKRLSTVREAMIDAFRQGLLVGKAIAKENFGQGKG